jgi:eukaryotic-like serine/threonine-protein kinase
MDTNESLKGKRGTYDLSSRRPFAYGRISVLYEGKDAKGNPVCLKLFKEMPHPFEDSETLSEFFRELEAQQKLSHPNILSILDFGEGSSSDPGPFIVYPLCQGGNLRQLLSGRSYLPLAEAIPILSQIAAAVDYAHGAGFLHGDIKPENVLFAQPNSYPLLSDFGMSRHYPISEDVSSKVFSSAMDSKSGPGGTSAYLSPEELEFGTQTTAVDIYSLGVLAYEVLTGSLPFEHRLPPYQQMRAKITGKIKDPGEANPALTEDVVAALKGVLAVDSRERPSTCAEFCDSLKGLKTKRKKKEGHDSFWNSLGPAEKAAIIVGIVAGLAGIITAAVEVLPDLLK